MRRSRIRPNVAKQNSRSETSKLQPSSQLEKAADATSKNVPSSSTNVKDLQKTSNDSNILGSVVRINDSTELENVKVTEERALKSLKNATNGAFSTEYSVDAERDEASCSAVSEQEEPETSCRLTRASRRRIAPRVGGRNFNKPSSQATSCMKTRNDSLDRSDVDENKSSISSEETNLSQLDDPGQNGEAHYSSGTNTEIFRTPQPVTLSRRRRVLPATSQRRSGTSLSHTSNKGANLSHDSDAANLGKTDSIDGNDCSKNELRPSTKGLEVPNSKSFPENSGGNQLEDSSMADCGKTGSRRSRGISRTKPKVVHRSCRSASHPELVSGSQSETGSEHTIPSNGEPETHDQQNEPERVVGHAEGSDIPGNEDEYPQSNIEGMLETDASSTPNMIPDGQRTPTQRRRRWPVHTLDTPTKLKYMEELKKMEESKELMAEKKRYYNDLVEPPDRKKMTLMDFIFWNPSINEMPSTDEPDTPNEAIGAPRLEEEQMDEPELQEGNNEEANAELAPQLKIGENGEIILDEESLVIQRPADDQSISETVVRGELVGQGNTTYASFAKKNRLKHKRWSRKETVRFYKALSIVGTDFMLMAELFPERSREELKKKFRLEERKHGELVANTMYNSIGFNTYELIDDNLSDDSDVEETKKQKRRRTRKQKESQPRKKRGRPKKSSVESNDVIVEDGEQNGVGDAAQPSAVKRCKHYTPRKRSQPRKRGKDETDKQDGTSEGRNSRPRKRQALKEPKSNNRGKESPIPKRRRSNAARKISSQANGDEGSDELQETNDDNREPRNTEKLAQRKKKPRELAERMSKTFRQEWHIDDSDSLDEYEAIVKEMLKGSENETVKENSTGTIVQDNVHNEDNSSLVIQPIMGAEPGAEQLLDNSTSVDNSFAIEEHLIDDMQLSDSSALVHESADTGSLENRNDNQMIAVDDCRQEENSASTTLSQPTSFSEIPLNSVEVMEERPASVSSVTSDVNKNLAFTEVSEQSQGICEAAEEYSKKVEADMTVEGIGATEKDVLIM